MRQVEDEPERVTCCIELIWFTTVHEMHQLIVLNRWTARFTGPSLVSGSDDLFKTSIGRVVLAPLVGRNVVSEQKVISVGLHLNKSVHLKTTLNSSLCGT